MILTSHAGETERTFFRVFCISNNLRAMLESENLPAFLKNFGTMIEQAMGGDEKTALLGLFAQEAEPTAIVDEKKVTPLPRDVYQGLLACVRRDPTLNCSGNYRSIYDTSSSGQIVLNAQGHLLSSIKHKGRRFCPVSHHVGDSNVIFRVSSNGDTGMRILAMGQIQLIFVHKRRRPDGTDWHQLFVAIRRYRALSQRDMPHDTYGRYTALRAGLVYEALAVPVEVIPVRNIVAHCVTCPYRNSGTSEACMVAFTLDEVSSLF
ncbi:hypothetical protein L227DRAFT_493713 [Lentinus tigrinus ALCF2SS1-6]|uniref:Uncharacterized protein n=1 Tax=Lentinus tigrinus ALCF2SS1-6 TaxID=1328759 RepID=A0A5C2SR21_9APHY|nr:hypothetical protein L227DRAFT_493713 [Lentinus tigrinus ALCF2SS1-6]